MVIGCVKEIKRHEYRVGITPANVKDYIAQGHAVLIQAGAGEGAHYFDAEYEKAGAQLVEDAGEVWRRSGMIVKVKEPLPEEYGLIREGQIVYTYFHLAANKALTETMLNSGCEAVAYETVRDRRGSLPLLRPMSEVAGRLSVQEGAKCLEKPQGGKGVLLGGVPGVPSGHVVILGGGVVGMNACKIAAGLSARVTVLDTNFERLEYLDDLFASRIRTRYSTVASIEESLAEADLVIGAVLIPGGKTPKIIRREHLKLMQPGTVIVDVAVDQGGCCETTHPTYHDDPTYVVDGVVHYCVANMPGAVARTSTEALTNATLRFGLAIACEGLEAAACQDEGLAAGVNCYEGKLTCREVAEAHGMEYTPLDALI